MGKRDGTRATGKIRLFPTRILFATDGSAAAVLAGRAVADLANTIGSGLHVVHARHPLPSTCT